MDMLQIVAWCRILTSKIFFCSIW